MAGVLRENIFQKKNCLLLFKKKNATVVYVIRIEWNFSFSLVWWCLAVNRRKNKTNYPFCDGPCHFQFISSIILQIYQVESQFESNKTNRNDLNNVPNVHCLKMDRFFSFLFFPSQLSNTKEIYNNEKKIITLN